MFPLLLALHVCVVVALKSELQEQATLHSTAAGIFTPSSLPLYPLDFQDTWQSSRPIPVDINYSVPHFGPHDLTSYLQEFSANSGVLTQQLKEREWQDHSIKGAEERAHVLLPYLRHRIVRAHRR